MGETTFEQIPSTPQSSRSSLLDSIQLAVQRIISVFGLAAFGGMMLILYPFYMVGLWFRFNPHYIQRLNRVWAYCFYKAIAVPVDREFRAALDANQPYVFCSNHFSFLDIPLHGLVKNPFVFVGKSSLAKVPLFGYLYSRLHITVDRDSLKSRHQALQRAIQAVDEGWSVVMFPEGGIKSEEPPQLARFKEGAFRIAIEKKVPIVPVTIPHNWKLLPNDGRLMLTRRPTTIIYHEPISTEGLTAKDVPTLKEKVFDIIQKELILRQDEN